MPSWALIFFVITVIGAVLGFTGLAGSAAWMAQVLFVVGVILFLSVLILGKKTP